MKKTLLNATLGSLAVATFVSIATRELSAQEPKVEPVYGQCHGVNSCKGKGSCAGKDHDCAGMNSCKGKGWVRLTEKECKEKKGKFVPEKKG